jgi:hypothetical protein
MSYTGAVLRVRAISVLVLVCVTATACSMSAKVSATGWTHLEAVPAVAPFSKVLDMSCASPSLCLAVGTTGPTAWWGQYGNGVAVFNGHSWIDDNFPYIGRGRCVGPDLCAGSGKGIRLVSCVPPHFCMAIDTVSESWVYNGTSWREVPLPLGLSPKIYQYTGSSLSCRTPTFCALAVNIGIVETFNGTSWGPPRSPLQDPSLWCGPESLCNPSNTATFEYAGTSWTQYQYNGKRLIRTVKTCRIKAGCAFSNGLEVPVPPEPGFGDFSQQLSCVSHTFCLSFDVPESFPSDRLITYRYDGTRWLPAGQLYGAGLSDDISLDCLSTSFCLILDSDSGSTWIWH